MHTGPALPSPACRPVFPKERTQSIEVPEEWAVGTPCGQSSTSLAFRAELLIRAEWQCIENKTPGSTLSELSFSWETWTWQLAELGGRNKRLFVKVGESGGRGE